MCKKSTVLFLNRVPRPTILITDLLRFPIAAYSIFILKQTELLVENLYSNQNTFHIPSHFDTSFHSNRVKGMLMNCISFSTHAPATRSNPLRSVRITEPSRIQNESDRGVLRGFIPFLHIHRSGTGC